MQYLYICSHCTFLCRNTFRGSACSANQVSWEVCQAKQTLKVCLTGSVSCLETIRVFLVFWKKISGAVLLKQCWESVAGVLGAVWKRPGKGRKYHSCPEEPGVKLVLLQVNNTDNRTWQCKAKTENSIYPTSWEFCLFVFNSYLSLPFTLGVFDLFWVICSWCGCADM